MRIVRSPWFCPAVLLMGLAGMFTFNDRSVAWCWAAQPQGAVILLLTSAVMWVLLVRNVHKHRGAR